MESAGPAKYRAVIPWPVGRRRAARNRLRQVGRQVSVAVVTSIGRVRKAGGIGEALIVPFSRGRPSEYLLADGSFFMCRAKSDLRRGQ